MMIYLGYAAVLPYNTGELNYVRKTIGVVNKLIHLLQS
jgi:hypothetical protein